MLKKIKKLFEKKGYFLFPTSERILSGVPDLIGVSPKGKFIGIEIKTDKVKEKIDTLPQPENLLRPIQKYFKDKILENNGEFYIYCPSGLFNMIKFF